MGYSTEAVALVGVCVKPQDMNAALYNTRRKRTCRHCVDDAKKFCPECGKPMFEVVYEPIEGFDEEEDTLFGFKLLTRSPEMHDEYAYIAYASARADRDQSSWIDENSLDMMHARKVMKKSLEHTGLFNEDAFGLHVFLYESC